MAKGNYNEKGKNPLKRHGYKPAHGKRKGSGSEGMTGGDYYDYKPESTRHEPTRSKGDDRFGTTNKDH